MGLNKKIWDDQNLVYVLGAGGVVVMPTDTLYGVVGSALNPLVVEFIYKLRKRNPEKPCIILIGSLNELDKFSIRLTGEERATLEKYWPPYLAKGGEVEATSIVIDCPNPSFSYLSRGTKTLAFRVPGVQALRDLLLKTGPLVAPSANLEGLPPAQSVDEARKYFREGGVDLYLDGGNILKSPSKVVRLHLNGSVSVLRQ